ncbi:hypothetical protein FIV00_03635 [Labrenzia sp. THAF82]|uniref:hypothetical protein n=1 Tax=Labrenzia sp. THAF82 TaxID=2587861 RepID=UPI001268D883|nr:hypothetical protein [Labrenzia sp. THAF82]QFT29561.1 hypothetical protein FIV00_03635 [Labrenzia sp. THAF82]
MDDGEPEHAQSMILKAWPDRQDIAQMTRHQSNKMLQNSKKADVQGREVLRAQSVNCIRQMCLLIAQKSCLIQSNEPSPAFMKRPSLTAFEILRLGKQLKIGILYWL